jgi:F0F1-type ATP synthase assembly protein I
VAILAIHGPWGIIAKQAFISLFGAVMAFAVAGMAGVWSFISGSLCVAMPSAYFAWVSQRTMQPGRIVAQGIVKMLSTCALMAGCLKMGVDDVLWFFLGLAACQGAYWWALVQKVDSGAETNAETGNENVKA